MWLSWHYKDIEIIFLSNSFSQYQAKDIQYKIKYSPRDSIGFIDVNSTVSLS